MIDIDKTLVVGALHEKVCEIVFTKANGDERVLHGTLKEDLLPQQIDVEEAIQKKTKKPNPDVLAVYDVQAEGWRSFRWDSVKNINLELTT